MHRGPVETTLHVTAEQPRQSGASDYILWGACFDTPRANISAFPKLCPGMSAHAFLVYVWYCDRLGV